MHRSIEDLGEQIVHSRIVGRTVTKAEQVLLECVSRGIAELREAADEAAKAPGQGVDRLRAFLCRYAEINMGDYGRCVIRTGDESLSADSALRFRALKREIDRALRALIEEAMADGSIARGDVKLIAFTLSGALNWPARWFRADGEQSAEAIARTMVNLLLNGLVGPKPAAPARAPATGSRRA